jgi:pyridoxine 5-phosphate synthase
LNLGVNIDHIALLREGRCMEHPDPLEALHILHIAGVDQVTIHLREDRRHIKDSDVIDIIKHSKIPVNLECALNDDIINFAMEYKPHRVTFVPEKREEVTTEGGLDLVNNFDTIFTHSRALKMNDVEISLFIDPSVENIKIAKSLEIDMVELHTGTFANIYAMKNSNLSKTHHSIKELQLPRFELENKLRDSIDAIKDSTKEAQEFGISVFAGHGLNYQNVHKIAQIENIIELNIGQSIIAKSIFVGLERAILDMKALL